MVFITSTTAGRYVHLTGADLDAIFALHLKATAAVGRPDLIKPD